MGRILIYIYAPNEKNAIIHSLMNRGVASDRIKVFEGPTIKEDFNNHNDLWPKENIIYLLKRGFISAVGLSMILHTIYFVLGYAILFPVSMTINIICIVFGIWIATTDVGSNDDYLLKDINNKILQGKNAILILYSGDHEKKMIKNLIASYPEAAISPLTS